MTDTGSREPRVVTYRWHLDGVADPPDASVVGTPLRRHGSIRRTTHLDATWPGGDGTPLHLTGRARDLVTSDAGTPAVRGDDEIRIALGTSSTIDAVATRPHRDGTERLVGASVMRGFRSAVDAALPDERAAVTPLAFLLDDVPLVARIGGIAWAQQRRLEIDLPRAPSGELVIGAGATPCSGLRPGGYYMQSMEKGITFPHWVRPAGDLDVGDEWAWHPLDPAPEVCFRRRRRVDAWSTGDAIEVDAHFRDSVWGPDHDELALHEYTLVATVDGASHELRSIDVESRVLPFPECPAAAPHVEALVGREVETIRAGVNGVLAEVQCCTHLNDMLRGLSDVPALVRAIGGS